MSKIFRERERKKSPFPIYVCVCGQKVNERTEWQAEPYSFNSLQVIENFDWGD